MIRVSAIILNFNGATDTIECLESLSKVNAEGIFLQKIVIDNHSTDDSVGQLRRYMSRKNYNYKCYDTSDVIGDELSSLDVVLIGSGRNGGFGFGNNVGIKIAFSSGADYVLLINNDTVVEPDFLSPLFKVCESESSVGIVCGQINYFDEPDRVWFNGGDFNLATMSVSHRDFGLHISDRSAWHRDSTFISGCLWLLPRKTIQAVGLLNESYFMYFEDVEYCHRVTEAGLRLVVEPESVIYHKVGSSGGGHMSDFSIYWTARNKAAFWKSNLGRVGFLAFLNIGLLWPFKCFLKFGYSAWVNANKGFWSGLLR
ncbi:Glycosyl transferase family 2 [Microbulbifer aggregans]|uniref:Glycosyl transferase family 2 n=1 Tax=Microbulbifer aggregans TaxID=1769779 RepID=A0A1C9W7R6_9GAMM|nr:glycosyltransferase family 2 protein [Microbulbifer aggregans]AOS97201.1 Glycosyl transferase family 2 [Microbulbifer aggregans]